MSVEGEVRFPGTYALMRRNERVTDLIRRAGGLTEFAYPRGVTFLRQGHASLAVDLPRALRRAQDPSNLVIQAGDVLRVPRFSPTVQIEGAVYSPVTALWQKGAPIGFYVTQASGFRENADRHNLVVISPNGRVRRHGSARARKPRRGAGKATVGNEGPSQGLRDADERRRQHGDHHLPRSPEQQMSDRSFTTFDAPGLIDEPASESGPGPREILATLWTRRRTIGAWTAGGTALLLVLSFVLPPSYVATVSLLEAPRQNGNSTLDQLGLSAQMLGLKNGGGTTNALTYPDILRSRRLLGGLLASSFPTQRGGRVRLDGYLDRGKPSPQHDETALKELGTRLDIALDRRTNMLRLGVKDRDPVLAAAVANSAAASLQEIVMHALMTQAGANRRFVEERLGTARVELTNSESALEAFRDANRHVDDSPRLLLVQARLMREVRTREEVLIALTREYEMARVDENRDVPVINVLDPAQPPAFRSAPRRGPMTAGGLLLGLAIGAGLAWPRRVNAPAGDVERAEAA